jgi:hypothetical protein
MIAVINLEPLGFFSVLMSLPPLCLRVVLHRGNGAMSLFLRIGDRSGMLCNIIEFKRYSGHGRCGFCGKPVNLGVSAGGIFVWSKGFYLLRSNITCFIYRGILGWPSVHS